MLFKNCKQIFFCWLKQMVKYYKQLYALVEELYTVKMFNWYQMNSKVFHYNTAVLVQIYKNSKNFGIAFQ